MCRHLAYLGEAATLRSLLTDPPHSLQAQAWAPRRQRHGVLNADGFGVGWYADGDPVPARYRRARPIWSDPSFADLARVTKQPGDTGRGPLGHRGHRGRGGRRRALHRGPLAVQP